LIAARRRSAIAVSVRKKDRKRELFLRMKEMVFVLFGARGPTRRGNSSSTERTF
jgi:hypothetical protein